MIGTFACVAVGDEVDGGIGVLLSAENVQTIVAVTPDSPADNAGLRAGDKITRVGGKSTDGLDLTNLVHLLRGEPGSTVELGVLKYMGGAEMDVSLAREELGDGSASAGVNAPVWTPSAASGDANMALILNELKKINERLDQLETGGAGGRSHSFADMNGPDRKALAEITPPKSGSREDWKAYVEKILEATVGQNSYSDRDPQVAMLAKVGEENIDVLIDAAADLEQPGQFHLNQAIKRIATEKSRQKIVAALKDNHELADIIVKMGWQDDARETLIDGLGADYLPTEWIESVARFKDPTTYDKLLKQFVSGYNKSSTYETIKDLPGINIKDSIGPAWERAKGTHAWERSQMAAIAAEYGYSDALDSLVRSLNSPEVTRNEHLQSQILSSLDSLIDVRAPATAEIAAWYEGIRPSLHYDPTTRRFKTR